MSTRKQHLLPLLSVVAALTVAGAPAAQADSCGRLQANYVETGVQIRQQCEQIRRSLDFSVCRGRRDSRACLDRVAAPHKECLRRNHLNTMQMYRQVGMCRRAQGARRGEMETSGFDTAASGARRFNSYRRPSLSRRLTNLSIRTIRVVAKGAMYGLKGAMDATSQMGRYMPTYTYTPSYRSSGSSYRRSSGGSYRSGSVPRCNMGNSRC